MRDWLENIFHGKLDYSGITQLIQSAFRCNMSKQIHNLWVSEVILVWLFEKFIMRSFFRTKASQIITLSSYYGIALERQMLWILGQLGVVFRIFWFLKCSISPSKSQRLEALLKCKDMLLSQNGLKLTLMVLPIGHPVLQAVEGFYVLIRNSTKAAFLLLCGSVLLVMLSWWGLSWLRICATVQLKLVLVWVWLHLCCKPP